MSLIRWLKNVEIVSRILVNDGMDFSLSIYSCLHLKVLLADASVMNHVIINCFSRRLAKRLFDYGRALILLKAHCTAPNRTFLLFVDALLCVFVT